MRSAAAWLVEWLWLLPHLTALVTLALLSLRLLSNLQFLRMARTQASQPATRMPRVSVLVPARDEAASIAACVTSLLDQRYVDLELVVLDDGSTDGTGDILDTLAMRDSRLTVSHTSEELPPGWNGKSYACHRLSQLATGEWLLFTDADTIHAPESIMWGVRQALALDVALLSAFPRQRTQTWSERILVSFIIDFIPLLTINFTALWRGRRTRIAANGQYLLAHAATYRSFGGHAQIHHALVDDFALANQFSAHGHGIALVDGGAMLTCRMYHNVHEVWNGFSKNLLGALSASPFDWKTLWIAPLFAWIYACLFVLPFVHLAASDQRTLAAVEICWLLLLRGLVVWRLRRPADELLTTPLAAWSVMALGIAAVYRRARNERIEWKGRDYAG